MYSTPTITKPPKTRTSLSFELRFMGIHQTELILRAYKGLFYLIIRFAKAYPVFHFVRFIYGLALGIM